MFGHPSQHQHMMSGVERAVSSPKTPAHLKPHLQKRLGGGSMAMRSAKGLNLPGGLKLQRAPLSSGGRVAVTPIPKGVPSSAPISTPMPKGVPGPGAINQPKPKGVPSSAPIVTPTPKGVGLPGPIRTPRPKGVGQLSSIAASQGTRNDQGGGGPAPSSVPSNTGVGNPTLDLGKIRPAIDNVPPNQTHPGYQRTRKLNTKMRGFGKSKNMNSAPNALFGEY